MGCGRTNSTNTFNTSIDNIYPIGSVYMSVTNNSPASIFGGIWEQIKDAFLVAVGDTYASGSTGGDAAHTHTTQGHTLTVTELPSHTHVQNQHRHTVVGNFSSGSGSSQAYTHDSNRTVQTRYTNYTTPTNQNTGGGGSHSHGDTGSASSMPPYLVVYMWKRIE